MANVDFPILTLPSKFVVAGRAEDSFYSVFTSRVTVAQHKIARSAGIDDAALSGLADALAADIEANYKSAANPNVLATARGNVGVRNGELLFTAVTGGTAATAITVAAATAAQGAPTVGVASNAITITLSNTPANNTTAAVIGALTASTAAAALITPSLAPPPGQSQIKGTNDGTGLVAAFAAVTLTQANTYSDFGKTRYLYANISTERGS